MKREGDDWVLSTGRRFYAHRGLLSVDEDGRLYDGYDSVVEYEAISRLDDDPPFSQAEREEIAAHMIKLWTEWKAKP